MTNQNTKNKAVKVILLTKKLFKFQGLASFCGGVLVMMCKKHSHYVIGLGINHTTNKQQKKLSEYHIVMV